MVVAIALCVGFVLGAVVGGLFVSWLWISEGHNARDPWA